MNIRRAKLEDAIGIAKVHVDSWRTTYRGIVKDEFLEELSYSSREKLWVSLIEKKDILILVAETIDGQIVGFASTNKFEDNLVENSIDLTALYLLEAYQGQGIGGQLMNHLFDYYKENGYTKVFVEVLKENKTKHFYEAYGAKHVKDVTIQIGGADLVESIYMWEIN